MATKQAKKPKQKVYAVELIQTIRVDTEVTVRAPSPAAARKLALARAKKVPDREWNYVGAPSFKATTVEDCSE